MTTLKAVPEEVEKARLNIRDQGSDNPRLQCSRCGKWSRKADDPDALRKHLIVFYKKSGSLPLSSDVDELIGHIRTEVLKARIDELVHAELAMAGNDESEGIEYRIERFKELGADNDFVVHCAACGKLNLNQFNASRPEHEEYCQCD